MTDYAAEAASHGAVYLEGIFTPAEPVGRGSGWDEVFAGYCDGARQAAEQHGVQVRLTPDIPRGCSLEIAEQTARYAVAYRDRGVVGIGLGGPEAQYPPEPYARAFEIARDGGLGSVPHAGEAAGPSSVRGALDTLRADRIRHGLRAADDPGLLRELAARGVVLDVCPISNLRTGVVSSLADHPLPMMVAAGVACSVSTDDPAMFDTDLSADYAAATMRSSQLSAVFAPGIAMVGNVITGVVLCYGGFLALDGDIKIGVLASFLLYLQRFFDPLQDVSQFYNSFQGAASALEKISGVLEEEPSVPEPPTPVSLPPAASGRRVSFSGVRFGYRKAIVLPGLDLDLPAGQTVALVGETGAGKTTVARLLARFYDPNAGQVLLDGVDLRTLPDSVLRQEIVLITQESFLFEGTVAENVRLGRPSATDAEVEEAARAIGAHTFIAALPDGYATKVGKRGGKLSAGQRQLLSFCRAFIAAPSVLVLDEATALLDIPSERLVQSALRTVLAGRTAVIIAHRLSTVAIADRVLVLRAGEIIEDGTPAELMRAGTGEYADLHARWAASLA